MPAHAPRGSHRGSLPTVINRLFIEPLSQALASVVLAALVFFAVAVIGTVIRFWVSDVAKRIDRRTPPSPSLWSSPDPHRTHPLLIATLLLIVLAVLAHLMGPGPERDAAAHRSVTAQRSPVHRHARPFKPPEA